MLMTPPAYLVENDEEGAKPGEAGVRLQVPEGVVGRLVVGGVALR